MVLKIDTVRGQIVTRHPQPVTWESVVPQEAHEWAESNGFIGIITCNGVMCCGAAMKSLKHSKSLKAQLSPTELDEHKLIPCVDTRQETGESLKI